jgi:hypothetical protein
MYVKAKTIAVESVPGMGVRGRRENGLGGELKYDIFAIL